MRVVAIKDETIRLGQFLKLADLVDSGAEGKDLIASGAVTVNGEPDTRRGRQLRPGDVVGLGEETAKVAEPGESPANDLPW